MPLCLPSWGAARAAMRASCLLQTCCGLASLDADGFVSAGSGVYAIKEKPAPYQNCVVKLPAYKLTLPHTLFGSLQGCSQLLGLGSFPGS